jgi:hypothetical protein
MRRAVLCCRTHASTLTAWDALLCLGGWVRRRPQPVGCAVASPSAESEGRALPLRTAPSRDDEASLVVHFHQRPERVGLSPSARIGVAPTDNTDAGPKGSPTHVEPARHARHSRVTPAHWLDATTAFSVIRRPSLPSGTDRAVFLPLQQPGPCCSLARTHIRLHQHLFMM